MRIRIDKNFVELQQNRDFAGIPDLQLEAVS